MNYTYVRLAGLLGQALYCLCIVLIGLKQHIPFFYTFIGPAAILLFIAKFPNYYFDCIAVSTMILMVILSLIFSFAVAFFNQNYLLAFGASAFPAACLAAVLTSMGKLKESDASYT